MNRNILRSSVSRQVKRQIVTFVKFIIYPLATIAKNTFDTAAPKQDLNSKLRRRSIGTNYDLDRKRGLASERAPFPKPRGRAGGLAADGPQFTGHAVWPILLPVPLQKRFADRKKLSATLLQNRPNEQACRQTPTACNRDEFNFQLLRFLPATRRPAGRLQQPTGTLATAKERGLKMTTTSRKYCPNRRRCKR